MAWNKYLTVEIPLLFCIFSQILQGAIITNLYIYRTCYVLLEYDKHNCSLLGNEVSDITKDLEPKVQPTVNLINMVHSITSNLIPIVFSMFVGTWSDKFGRKPFLLLSLLGIVLTTGTNTLIIHFENMSPWWFTISSVPSLLTGGFGTLMIVISAYITDITTEKDRLVRLAIFEVIFATSAVIANLISSYVLYATSYQTIYMIATGLTGMSLIYTFFCIPESLTKDKQPISAKEIIKSINIKDLFRHFVQKRENNARPYIFLIFAVQLILGLSMGDMSVGTLFLRAKLDWKLSKVTITQSITSVGNILGTLFSTYFLYRTLKIKELKLALFGLTAQIIASTLRGIATNDYYIFVAYGFGIFMGLPGLMFRTILSFMVGPEEMGKIFALSNIIMSLDNLIASILYPLLYNATLNTNPGIYNFVVVGIFLIVFVIVLFMLRLKFPYMKRPTDEENKSEEKKISITVNNIAVTGINVIHSGRPSLEIDTRRMSQSPALF